MADFGDAELFEQLDEPAPPVPTHTRFADDDDGDQGELELLRSSLHERELDVQRLLEENILIPGVAPRLAPASAESKQPRMSDHVLCSRQHL